ncbi:unnamed protein product [Clonostachys chloroleuca]|uniref:Uncharacterized protein n=1 Tax=Clonostachys chloroleuca TaxID=1926264 RepID=A0AA35Q153_9HYPO|nr:unnamed protein product [Clonostachys chloroleuca]
MPYFCFSPMDTSLAKFKEEQEKHHELLNIYKDSAIHGSPTLDEWYYHFGPDSDKEKDHRNRDQVVFKFLKGAKDIKSPAPSEKDEKDSDGQSADTFIRVNQLWVWTIADEWLITATSVVFDNEHDTSQPQSVADMSKLVVEYCIGSYERQPKPQELISIGKIFSQYVNQLGRLETTLFEEFREQTQSWQQQEAASRISSGASPYDKIRKKVEDLFRDIKDIRDELNILRSAAHYQKTVQRKLYGREVKDADLSAETVLNDIREIDVVAERIQLAVNTTLSLQQSEISNYQATLATAQGKTVMAFTFATVLFLPLSFLSSLFALDVSSFQQTPAWAFYVICKFHRPYIHIRTRRILTMNDQVFVSIAVSLVLGFVAFYWHKITKQLLRIFQDADLQKASKDDDFAKTEKKEDSTPPIEPPAVNGKGMYHHFRGHGKAKQESHV